MQRKVTAHIDAELTGPVDIALSISVAAGPTITDEKLTVLVDEQPMEFSEIREPDGTRLHVANGLPSGRLAVDYAATVDGQAEQPWDADLAPYVYTRPSRYCESDAIFHIARAEFGELDGHELVQAIRQWVADHVLYFSGWSRVTDGAVDTYLQRQGVCRDFAHLVIALLRARYVPARLASVYAPGLNPMDFHAVAEAYVDGRWVVIDATGLAPRSSMLRIATGRDAADTAFMTTTRGSVRMGGMWVTATVDPFLPTEDPADVVVLT